MFMFVGFAEGASVGDGDCGVIPGIGAMIARGEASAARSAWGAVDTTSAADSMKSGTQQLSDRRRMFSISYTL